MACDCASARRLSGPGAGNLTKVHAESIRQPISWCAVVGSGVPLDSSAWDVSPVTAVPLVISDETSSDEELETSAILSGGQPNQVYQVSNVVTAGGETFVFLLWVYVRGSGLPQIYVPCEGELPTEITSSQVVNLSSVAGVTVTAALNALASLVAAIVSGQLSPVEVVADSPSTALDFTASRKVNLTLDESTELAITWPTVPQVVVLRIYQGPGGSYVPTFPPEVRWPGNVVPTWSTGVGKWDELSIDWDGTSGTASYGLDYGP